MHHGVGAQIFQAAEYGAAVANVQFVVSEGEACRFEPALVPPCVALRPEEVGAHVVIDPVDFPTEGVKVRYDLGTDQPGRPGDEHSHGTGARDAISRTVPTTRAGFPATIAPAATFFVTTAAAPTTASAPMVTPFRMIDRAPTNASLPIWIGALAAPRVP